jgi:hypothetical protein
MDQVDNGQRAVGLPQEVRSFRSRLQTYSREMNNVVIAVVLVHKYTYRIPEFQTAHSPSPDSLAHISFGGPVCVPLRLPLCVKGSDHSY